MSEAEILRQELAQAVAGRRGAERRYPADLKERAVVVFRERRAAGASLRSVAQELGLRALTLSRWESRAARRFRPVRVATPDSAPPCASRPVVVTRNGDRVEGLELEQVVALLRALA
jgi:transposase-like protein